MKRFGNTVLIITIQFVLVSCVSLQVSSSGFVKRGSTFHRNEVFSLEPMKVISFNYVQGDEIGYIMDQKLRFALSTYEKINFTEGRERGSSFILPELIIKSYERKYERRNYYLLSVKVLSGHHRICQFNYEYNGASSIFDSKVQNIMIKKFMGDFKKVIE